MSSKKKHSKKRKQSFKRKRRMALTDIFLSFLYIICAFYAAYTIVPLGLIPQTWCILIGLILTIILLTHLIVSLVKLPTLLSALQRIFIIVLSAAFIAGSYTVEIVDEAVEEVIEQPTSYKQYISIIALRDSGIISIEDIANQKIAIQDSLDTESMDKAVEYLNTYETAPKTSAYRDYNRAVQALYKGEVKAMVMSETYRDLIEENNPEFKEKTAIIDAVEIEVPVVDIVKQIDVTSNAFTVLVSGIDSLGSARQNINSDVNIIVTVNPLTKTIVMTSLPRDSYVPNANLNGEYDKLTHTGYQGIDCTVKTIEDTFDIEINYYVKMSFSSIINVVNALGGLEIDVPMSFCERKANRVDIIYLKKGRQILNGEQVLALARNRQNVSGGDVGRAKNQQMIVNAIIKKCLNPDILNKVDSLIAAVGDTVQMNITKKEIYSFVNMLANDLTTPWTISNNVVAGENSWGECASIPGLELSVMRLSDEEINRVKYIVKQATTDADLSELSLNINDIEITEQEQTTEMEGETDGAKGYDFCWIELKQQQAKEEAENAEDEELEGPSDTYLPEDFENVTPEITPQEPSDDYQVPQDPPSQDETSNEEPPVSNPEDEYYDNYQSNEELERELFG